MYNTNTKFSKKTLLSQYVLEQDGSLTLLSLFSLGIMGAITHQYLRLGLNLPGHHGLEWMTLLLFGRMQARQRWAGFAIASAAASTYLLHTVGMAMVVSLKPVLVYLINGVCVDVLFRIVPTRFPLHLKGLVIGGLAFLAKPLMFIAATLILGLHFDSVSRHGYLYPLLTHLGFGSIGGLCGMTLANAARRPQTGKMES